MKIVNGIECTEKNTTYFGDAVYITILNYHDYMIWTERGLDNFHFIVLSYEMSNQLNDTIKYLKSKSGD